MSFCVNMSNIRAFQATDSKLMTNDVPKVPDVRSVSERLRVSQHKILIQKEN